MRVIGFLIFIFGAVLWQTNVLSAGFDYSTKGCEYVITFPVQPDYIQSQVFGLETIMAITPNDHVPCLRAECVKIADKSLVTDGAIREFINYQANSIGISGAVRFEKKSLGTIASLYGMKSIGKLKVNVVLRIYIGSQSLLNTVVVEETQNFPSVKTIKFWDSVRRR